MKRRFQLTTLTFGTPGKAGIEGIEGAVPKTGLGHWLESIRLTLKIWLKRGRLPGWFAHWLRCWAVSGSGNRQMPPPPVVLRD